MKSVKEGNLEKDPIRVAEKGVKELEKKFFPNYIPGIEDIQDVVEEKLILMDFPRKSQDQRKAKSCPKKSQGSSSEKQNVFPRYLRRIYLL